MKDRGLAARFGRLEGRIAAADNLPMISQGLLFETKQPKSVEEGLFKSRTLNAIESSR